MIIYKPFILTLSAILVSVALPAQEMILDLSDLSVSECAQFEKEHGGTQVSSDDFRSFNPDDGLIKFTRTEIIIPPLICAYHFSKKDSSIRKIEYEWNARKYSDLVVDVNNPEFIPALIQKHMILTKDLSDLYGSPVVEKQFTNLKDPVQGEQLLFIGGSDNQIKLSTYIQTDTIKKGLMTTIPSYKTSVTITKASDGNTESFSAYFDELEALAQDFLKYVIAEDPKTNDNVDSTLDLNSADIIDIKNNFKSKDEFRKWNSGMILSGEGEAQTRFVALVSTKEYDKELEHMIKIEFNDDKKIVEVFFLKLY